MGDPGIQGEAPGGSGEIKDIQTRKEETKLSLFANDTILYIENPETFSIKLLEQVNNLSKDAR